MSDEWAIRTTGLTKRFGRRTVVDRIDVAVPRGAVYGFLGPNGSGKTTTIRMLLGLAAPNAGEMWLLGHRMPAAARQVLPEVGALVEGPAWYPFLSGTDNLARFDAANPAMRPRDRQRRIAAALDRVGLSHVAKKKVRAYSLGMKQRLGIAAALLAPRQLLVLDEPTNGLDPQGTREVRALIRSLAEDGTTVFVSSHLLSEVEQICTHVGVMSRGKLVAQGDLTALRRLHRPRLVIETPDVERALRVLDDLALRDVQREQTHTGSTEPRISAELDGVLPEDVCAALVHAGVRVRGLRPDHGSLEDVFVSLTGEGFDVDG
ncbi:ABC transporter related protein [Acidothermus cellulolyticus 11B]|jgi:ABC-2 type transport system ATP-binding protein|uniref:ABC transporter related protein n=1 Tax=Acidothermus cellulolyticus (strain ATCC 43068 / DSM 8971 / 11B) TaxID=351607 RepID=A0LTE2_ACIC1|nr:ATP-binding cassette domain-containing protein [Acidothermus cellulolyticus]ABK52702.1 ABC transporter related protein [Acidothermus cellulolyticus 11B]